MTTKLTKKPVTKKTTVKTPATKAREKKPVGKSIIEAPVIVEAADDFTPNKNYIKPTVSEVSSSNWWLDNTINENWAYVEKMFTPEECKKIIEIGESGTLASPMTYGVVGDLNHSEEDIKKIAKIRRSPIAWIRSDLQDNHWIYQRMAEAIKTINNQFFGYELTEIQSLQFTSYDVKEKGFYGKHIDMMYRGTGTRKLSVTIQLSDPANYEGGDLLLHTSGTPEKPEKKQGMGVFFPGYTLHEVTPVTKGKRYSLVAWVLGPKFK
jgi:PKHD-type hydroxylase